MSYEAFFYSFEDFPDRPTYAQIRRRVKAGNRRLSAFEHFKQKFPEDIEYRLGYMQAYVEEGVYDDRQFAHCFEQIDQALHLEDRKGAHEKLNKIRARLEQQHREYLAEAELHSDDDDDPFDIAMRTGDHEKIDAEFARLEQTVKPRGIMGGDDERLYWRLLHARVQIAFEQEQPQRAMELFEQYEAGRIALKLTPMPDYNLQETLLGYLASQSVELARARLIHWLENSRMPTVPDAIKQHPAFADLFQSMGE